MSDRVNISSRYHKVKPKLKQYVIDEVEVIDNARQDKVDWIVSEMKKQRLPVFSHTKIIISNIINRKSPYAHDFLIKELLRSEPYETHKVSHMDSGIRKPGFLEL